MKLIEVLFWIFCFFIIFHYLGFGALVLLFGQLIPKKKPNDQLTDDELPTVTFIVAAFNEARIIEKKILNDLNLDYPKTKLEIIVISDGSTDNTPQIIEKLSQEHQILKSMFLPERKGKTAALNRAIATAKNDILVFSDGNSFFRKNALKKLVRHFERANIGGVCGQKSIVFDSQRKASLGDQLYWLYESSLKQAESHLGSIPTADGEIFALRKNIYKPVNEALINDDLVITLDIINQGYRVIYDKEAITEEEASITLKDDFNVKARMVYGGLQILSLFSKTLNPVRSWFGLQFFFHKTLRYMMWMLLLGVFITNFILLFDNLFFYKVFFLLQIIFYIMALLGYIADKLNFSLPLVYLPYYYCNVNVAAFKGYLFFLKQKSNVDVWKKAQR